MSRISYINCPSCMKLFKFFKDDKGDFASIHLKCPNCKQEFSISLILNPLSNTNDSSNIVLLEENQPHTASVDSLPVVDNLTVSSNEYGTSSDES